MFGGERAPDLGFADISVSIPPEASREKGEVQWPSGIIGKPEREFATIKSEKLDREQALRRFGIRLDRTSTRSIILFVHG